MQVEFDRRLLNDLRDFAEEDGVGSLYQMVRNICWNYAAIRKQGSVETKDGIFDHLVRMCKMSKGE